MGVCERELRRPNLAVCHCACFAHMCERIAVMLRNSEAHKVCLVCQPRLMILCICR